MLADQVQNFNSFFYQKLSSKLYIFNLTIV